MNNEQETNKEQDIFYKLVDKAKEVKLTERERTALFSHVDSYIKRNPLAEAKAKPERAPLAQNLVKSPFWGNARTFAKTTAEKSKKMVDSMPTFNGLNWTVFHSYGFRAASVFILVGVLGTGTSLAAQGSLPGDFLYPVKVSFNEEIKSVFLFGRSDVEYQVDRTKARVDEVKKLAEQNRLNDEVTNKATVRIDNQITKVKKDLDSLANKGELKTVFEITNKLEGVIKESEDEVTKLAVGDDKSDQILAVKKVIRSSKAKTIETREGVEEKISATQENDEEVKAIANAKYETVKLALAELEASSATRMALDVSSAASSKISENSADIASATLMMSSEISVDPEVGTTTLEAFDPLAKARDLFVQGEEKMNSGEYNEAFRLFREAMAIIEDLNSAFDEQNSDIPNPEIPDDLNSNESEDVSLEKVKLEKENEDKNPKGDNRALSLDSTI